jgi:hypothetical protein
VTSGWETLNAAVAEARAQIAAKAPDASVAAEGEAYVTRVMAAGLGGAVLGHLFNQDGLSRALPCYGGPNPDYIMRFAPIDAAGSYRLDGQLNGSERVGVGLYSYGANGAPLEEGYAAFDAHNALPDGSFAIDLGVGAEASGGLAIKPGTRVMLVRVLHRDDSDPARLRFRGATGARGLALATGSNDGALSFVAQSLANNVREYLKWTDAVQAHANRFDVAPPELTETVQGDRDTQYFLGSFDLAEGEWLEVTMSADIAGYWSINGYNYWFEHLQTPGVHDRNAVTDADGRVRIAIGPDLPPESRNRIDTLGRRRGSLICRIIGTGGCPQAAVRVHR